MLAASRCGEGTLSRDRGVLSERTGTVRPSCPPVLWGSLGSPQRAPPRSPPDLDGQQGDLRLSSPHGHGHSGSPGPCCLVLMTTQAFVTLATNDMYCQGALVLGLSLRNHKTSRKLVVLITPEVSSLDVLSRVFDEVVEVNLMDSEDYIHLAFLRRPELGVTLTKLHCWTLTRYSKCVFLDADTLVLHNIDELFDREELSAAPDPGWPDCFNSGVFVFQPSLETHQLLLQHATEHGSFDGADQGLLNSFFRDWPTADIHKHLPFIYNLTSNAAYTYSPAFQQFGSSAKVVHFLGSTKPWNCTYDPQTGSVSEQGAGSGPRQHVTFLNLWWRLFQEGARPLQSVTLPDCMTSGVGLMSIQEKPKEPSPEEERKKWEEGRIDYMGKDAFSRIQEKLDRFLH
uniref:glycogenin glucosyltransferase n=1 Tax=Urocitellus parryii TaxID=9999 RepID=A0A8D2I4R5_UROPR